MTADDRPVICHIVYRLDFGGLENGLVNVINGIDPSKFRHAIITLTEATDFADRIRAADVAIVALNKRSGKDPGCYWRMYRALRRLRPQLVHTRNLGTLEYQAIAWLAGVPARIHGEHGWDVYDPQGTTPRYVRLRRLINPLIHRYVALSEEIETWLRDGVRVGDGRVARICNGVDTERFIPRAHCWPAPSGTVTIGTVIRLTDIKDPLNLVDAFALLVRNLPASAPAVRLLIVGDGPLRDSVRRRVQEAGIESRVELAGSQMDVLPWLQRMDVFVLGSRREGISNTILEAMACGLPVVATRTGGNVELVDEPGVGRLVPPADPGALATAMGQLVMDPVYRRSAGEAARERAMGRFSLRSMIERYTVLYDGQLQGQA